MGTDKFNQENIRLAKAIEQVRPFFFYQDSHEVGEGKYEKVGLRVKKRAVIFLVIALLCAVIFMFNGFFNLFMYLEQSRIFELILGILWILIGLLSAYQGMKYSVKLKAVSQLLLSEAKPKDAA